MKKKSFFATIVAMTCLFSSLGKTNYITGSAQTSPTLNTLTMENGAAVRLKSLQGENGEVIESNGLRFSAEISADEFTALKEAGARFGAIIVAKDLLKATEINEQTVFGNSSAFYFTNEANGDTKKIAALHIAKAACENIDEDANVEICGSIVNLQTSNFTRSFVGRIYVAIPYVNAETGETEYTYHFAPYYQNDINNNSRCIFYVAQRAIEENKANAATLQEKYVTPFKATSRYTNYTYRYFVEHCYIVHDENGEHKIAHIETTSHYDTLDKQVTATPIIKPDNVPAIADLNFVYDLDASQETQSGLLYAAGMQTLRLYYETASTINEEHKEHTLASLIAHFLNVDNAHENFGLHINGYGEDWIPAPVYDPEDPETQIGISLTAESNASKARHLLLSKHFFDELRAFGVESISFDFHTAENSGKAMKFAVYQEEDESLPLPVWNADGTVKITEQSGEWIENNGRITLYLKDITPGGGVMLEVHQSSSSNKGIYHFGHIGFTFPTTDTGLTS